MTVEELIEELKRRNPRDRVGVSVRTRDLDHYTAEIETVSTIQGQRGIDLIIVGQQ